MTVLILLGVVFNFDPFGDSLQLLISLGTALTPLGVVFNTDPFGDSLLLFIPLGTTLTPSGWSSTPIPLRIVFIYSSFRDYRSYEGVYQVRPENFIYSGNDVDNMQDKRLFYNYQTSKLLIKLPQMLNVPRVESSLPCWSSCR